MMDAGISKDGMPSVEEVIVYAEKCARNTIFKKAQHLPKEIHAEMIQEAKIAAFKAYSQINLTDFHGWRRFISQRVSGEVLDYMKLGKTFGEERWTLSNESSEEESDENEESLDEKEEIKQSRKRVPTARERISIQYEDGDEATTESILALHGVFGRNDYPKLKLNWDLLARLASKDLNLHIFIKKEILEFGPTELGEMFGFCKSRICQISDEFIENLDQQHYSPWEHQVIFALGLAETFGIENVSQKDNRGNDIGSDLEPIDFWSHEKFCEDSQGSLF